MAKKYTQEEIENILSDNGIILLSPYINSTTKLKMKCSCGKIFEKTWKIMNKNKKFKCNDCIKKEQVKAQTMSYEIAKQKVEERGYKLLTLKEDYIKASIKNKIQCPNGHIYEQILLDLFKGHGCKKCASKINGDRRKLNFEEVKNKINNLGWELLSENYNRVDDKLKIRCKKCNNIFYSSFHNLQKGSGCPHCYKQERGKSSIISYEERLLYVNSFGYDIITPEQDYKNGEHKVTLRCPKGHLYEAKLHDFYIGNRCPKCRESKGERKVREFLKTQNLKYIEQYKFEDCKAQTFLPFDFYLPDYNCCIEYDGKQHYKPSSFYGGVDSFIGAKVRDTIKNIYCEQNNIKLIRIPYWDYKNIEKILNKELFK